jgi:hypothetical protein
VSWHVCRWVGVEGRVAGGGAPGGAGRLPAMMGSSWLRTRQALHACLRLALFRGGVS